MSLNSDYDEERTTRSGWAVNVPNHMNFLQTQDKLNKAADVTKTNCCPTTEEYCLDKEPATNSNSKSEEEAKEDSVKTRSNERQAAVRLRSPKLKSPGAANELAMRLFFR